MNIRATVKNIVVSVLGIYSPWICRWEYHRQKHTLFNERPIEFGFVFRKLGELYPLRILDVGTGKTALPHLMRNCGFLVTATDNIRDYWQTGMRNRHYHVIDDDIRNSKLTEKYDLVTCVSVLEHIVDYDSAIKNMFNLLVDDGHLVLTCPYTENSYIENVYDLENSSYGQNESFTTQSYSRVELDRWLATNGGKIVEQEYWQFWEGEHWTVDKQIIPPVKVSASDKHQLTCLLIQKCGQQESAST